jgi:hypothetical protein
MSQFCHHATNFPPAMRSTVMPVVWRVLLVGGMPTDLTKQSGAELIKLRMGCHIMPTRITYNQARALDLSAYI